STSTMRRWYVTADGGCSHDGAVIQRPTMASIPPPPDQPTIPVAPIGEPAPPGPSSRAMIVAIVGSVGVIAIIGATLAIANSGGSDAGATPTISPSSAPAPPVGVAAHPSAFKVVLTWTAGGGSAPIHFVVSRNGAVAATLDPTATRWVDPKVLPETRYIYTIAAVGSDGTRASSRITSRTTSAPLDTAELR